jgi:hypothetical protein
MYGRNRFCAQPGCHVVPIFVPYTFKNVRGGHKKAKFSKKSKIFQKGIFLNPIFFPKKPKYSKKKSQILPKKRQIFPKNQKSSKRTMRPPRPTWPPWSVS